MSDIRHTKEEMEILTNLALELTRMRQEQCPMLVIETFAPETLAKLKFAWHDPHGYLNRLHGVPVLARAA